MTKFIVSIFAFFDWVFGYVVAFVKTFLKPDKFNEHWGFQSFVSKTRAIAVEVTLRFHRWLSLLLHSPTVA